MGQTHDCVPQSPHRTSAHRTGKCTAVSGTGKLRHGGWAGTGAHWAPALSQTSARLPQRISEVGSIILILQLRTTGREGPAHLPRVTQRAGSGTWHPAEYAGWHHSDAPASPHRWPPSSCLGRGQPCVSRTSCGFGTQPDSEGTREGRRETGGRVPKDCDQIPGGWHGWEGRRAGRG